MKKRIFSIILVLCMLTSLAPMVFAASANGSCGDNLAWELDKNGTLTISGTGEMIWNSAEVPWADYMSDIKALIIEEGVKSVRGAAFMGCENLASAVFPDTLQKINMAAFSGCISLKEVVIPDSVISLDFGAFEGCTALETVKLGSGLACIADWSFKDCTNLKTLIMPIEFNTIDFEENSIWAEAFMNCSIETVIIPKGTTNISNMAFGDCKTLTAVFIPDTVTCIAFNAFGGSGLTDIYYQGTEAQWSAIDLQGGFDEPNTEVLNATVHFGFKYYPYPFTDIGSLSTEFRCGVLWAYLNGITSGTTATTFEPNKPCTRAEVVTFLWRLCGSPEPETAKNPFTDVSESSVFYKAILWAYENGITMGTTETTFAPKDTVTRAQFVTFLWRLCGEETVDADNNFSDVSDSSVYAKAIIWASSCGIVNGYGNGTFCPNNPCTRAHVAVFLYRTFQ